MARTVPLKLSYNARRSLVRGPQYTIQEDPPWLLNSEPPAEVVPRASSTYSHDFEVNEAQDDIMAEDIYPNSVTNEDAAQYKQPAPSPPAHEVRLPTMPQQPRTSRLPVFQQVRSMLKSRNTGDKISPTSAVKWDEYSGELSEHGKEAKVKPSTYKLPSDGIVESRRLTPVRARAESGRDRERSPVSMLIEEDLHILNAEPGAAISPPNSRPVSPMSDEQQFMPQPRRDSEMARPRTEGNATGQLKRKPVASQIDNFPPVGDERIKPNSSHGEPQSSEDPSSRFSWTTAAYSEAPRQSTDTRMSRRQRSVTDHDPQPNASHFSWSTVASAVPTGLREQTPPPSPPPVPIQFLETPQYGPPPTQSILSRQRPLKRLDKPEWAPPPPTTSSFTPRTLTPKVYRIQQEDELSTTPGADGKKRLPLPPLFTEKSLSHLEALLTQEKNIVMQRRNIERSIIDLERIEKASPLDVSFADVRDAKKKLEERRSVLDEIRKEEMDIGIRISRARRKEDFGDGEGTLWVRRVTG